MRIGGRFIIILFVLLTFYDSSFAQNKLMSYTFEQLNSLQMVEKRNVIVFIHTSWCKYCKAMQNTTLIEPKIIDLLNDKFYFIDLDAELRTDISFGGQTFRYRPKGTSTGVHELAEQLAIIDNKITYPTLCILNPKNEIIFQYDQYISAQKLKPILKTLTK